MAAPSMYPIASAYNMESEIEANEQVQVSHGNLQFKTRIDDRIVVPHCSVIAKYHHALNDFIIDVEYTDEEFRKYYQSPKMLSMDLYGTYELWSWLLYINNCKSVANFTNPKLKVFTSNIMTAINEILTIYSKDLKANKEEVYPDE